jgi:hypothetical protein
MVGASGFLALLGSGASSPSGSSSAEAQQKYQPPIKVIDPTLLPAGFDCSKIREMGIDRQENFRASVQKNDLTFTQYFCNGTGGAATGGQDYAVLPCGTPSPIPTATATATATPTATTTPRATSTPRATPTPRVQPTLRSRPTPPHRPSAEADS